jgi:hypothetical protein
MERQTPYSRLFGRMAVAVLLIVASGSPAAAQGRQVPEPRLVNPAADAQVERILAYLERAESCSPFVEEREAVRLAWNTVRCAYYERRRDAYYYEFWRLYGAHWLQATNPRAWVLSRRERLRAMRRAEWARRKAAKQREDAAA